MNASNGESAKVEIANTVTNDSTLKAPFTSVGNTGSQTARKMESRKYAPISGVKQT